MNRTLSLSILAVAAVGALAVTRMTTGDTPKTPRLVGAGVEIDASNFLTLQEAFDALPESGGVVRIPPGEFIINEPLVVSRGDVLIQGSGAASHIVNKNETGKPALILHHKDGAEVKKADRLWRVSVQDLRITGNEKSGHGLLAEFIEEIFLQGLTISEHGADGIRLDHCYEDPRVSDCLITYNKQVGLNLLGCHDIVVSACQFEENNDALHCFDGFNLCMTGNCLDDHLRHGVVIENTYGSVLSGNMIEECNGSAVILDRDCYGITLSANVIAHDGAGIELKDAHGCAVSANTFTIMKTNALYIGPASDRISVTGNNFCNSYIGDGKIRRGTKDMAAAGIVLDSTSSIAISGNIFSSTTTTAVELRGKPTVGVVFGNNVLTDVESDHTNLKGAAIANNVSVSAPKADEATE
jgi:hypothetical protein